MLSAWYGAERVGCAFFDIDQRFQVVGLQSGRIFDELRVAFVNPQTGTFSLDELLYDLDLTDADRDGVPDFLDRCPGVRDTLQLDSDGDGIGDLCDSTLISPLAVNLVLRRGQSVTIEKHTSMVWVQRAGEMVPSPTRVFSGSLAARIPASASGPGRARSCSTPATTSLTTAPSPGESLDNLVYCPAE